ncbi:DNA polymerase I [Steroidobacter sp. S1-65]|uniref:DNA polymerase I n=1 Tax=Steroidobacter gossypii TaxID=2805490 RepID=A0ABS1WSI1_9GAMM|nr:DNA polymerase I [Steroidobacter gossypii]MBM0103938.1 DNA polymerase I [Steroidobacter gossypii]
MAAQRKLVLVDGSGYLYRAFHALPPLTNSRGEPTGAVLGVLNMLQKLRKEETPDLIAVVFDAPGKTFRDALFESYKAQRTPMPDDLRSQLQPLLDSVNALGLPCLRVDGVEADDVIGTLAQQAAAQGYDVIISTGDKDMAQLVNDRITLVNTMTGSRLNREGVKAKFDVYPEQIVDYLALVGDTSDNIPGIPKVGPKTAAKWLGEYGTLDKVVENAASITGKVGENLRAGMKELELSRKLATLDCNVKLDTPFETLRVGEPDRERLKELFTRLEFRALLRQVVGGDAADEAASSASPAAPAAEGAPIPAPVPRNYETVLTAAALEIWVAQLKSANVISLNLATTSAGYMQADIVGIAFSIEPGTVAYVPMSHDYPGAPAQLSRDAVLQALRPVLESEQPLKVGYDLKYKGHVLKRAGIELRGDKFDIMLESYVLNSTATKHELSAISRRYLGIDPIAYESVAGKGAKQLQLNQVGIDVATNFVAEEADLALQLHRLLWPRLEGLPALQGLYETIEQPLLPVLLRMEQAGVLLDGDLLRKQSGELATRMREIESQAYAAAGGPFSLESPKQLQEVLFGKLGLPVIRKTPTGQPSTAEDVLEELAASYELPKLIMDYRAFAKLKSTYTDKLPLQINRSTQRVHTCYQQAIAATGRLSSADPNLQNIPIRTPEGRRIRQAFVAPSGQCIVAADYSQIELRIMAHLSGDEGLLQAFGEDRDIHLATAAEVFSMTLDTVSADQRRTAKMINFGLIYGMSPFGLASRLGIERSVAAKYVDLYFQRYPGVRRYMDETRQLAHERGYVETVFGRRLYLNDINARNAGLRQAAERAAINAPMQGTAADIIKRAMIQVDHWLQQSKLPARLLLQVHDELVFEVRRDLAEDLIAHVRELMSGAAELRVPLKVDAGIGENWDEAH